MELKKLHMGTMAYNIDTMDEIANQLDAAFGKQQGKGRWVSYPQGFMA